jgi:uncharacterized protein (UPF0147 family)
VLHHKLDRFGKLKSFYHEGVVYKKFFYHLSEDFEKSTQILKVIENVSHHYSHNIRTKNKVIRELNYKLQTILKIQEEIISDQKSPQDKRIIIYKIANTYFN